MRLRQAELKSYLGEAPPGDALWIREALVEAVASEGAWTAAEYVLTEVGKAIGTAIPIANIVISIATIALDLRSKIRALQSRYEPGDIDLMLNLSEEMGVEREAVKDAIKLFGEISSLSSTELKLKPESVEQEPEQNMPVQGTHGRAKLWAHWPGLPGRRDRPGSRAHQGLRQPACRKSRPPGREWLLGSGGGPDQLVALRRSPLRHDVRLC